MKKERIIKLTECAIMIALATVLSMCKLWQAPLGGSVTLLSTFPILFISVRYGIAWGLSTGFIYSIIQCMLSLNVLAYIPTPIGIFGGAMLDYILPYTLLGLAGIFMYLKPKTNRSEAVCIIGGVIFAIVLRFICYLLSGVIIWNEITKEGHWNDYVFQVGKWTYSFVYNISFLGPDSVIVLVASPVMIKLRKIGTRKI